MSIPPFVLLTDYGWDGPYVGLLHAAIRSELPGVSIIDLQHDLPPFRPHGAGILLRVLLDDLPRESTVVAVVDPGVGSERNGLVLTLGGRTLVGPDNGLFAPLLARAEQLSVIDWHPAGIPPSFHGRDWFVPVAVRLARSEGVCMHAVKAEQCVGFDWSMARSEVIYTDRFGNLMTGIPGESVDTSLVIGLSGQEIGYARTFAEVPRGTPFWHINALGLLELAVNQGSAARLLGLDVGDPVPFSF